MPRIAYPDVEKLPETMRRTLESTPINVVKIGALASPALFEAQGRLGMAVADPKVLDPKLRETVILRVAHLSNSAYELHHHRPLALKAGLTEADQSAIERQDYARLDPVLAAAARFTDEVVRDLSPSDETLAQLRARVSDQVLVNILLAIGCYMSIARLIATTGIEIDETPLARLPTVPDIDS